MFDLLSPLDACTVLLSTALPVVTQSTFCCFARSITTNFCCPACSEPSSAALLAALRQTFAALPAAPLPTSTAQPAANQYLAAFL